MPVPTCAAKVATGADGGQPDRDTPEELNRYTAYFHPRIIGLTGLPSLVRRVADNFKVRYEKIGW
jgi:cytochrome oxidase Cu insertion factor (SCO1/SenC/PrrC family)